MAATVKKAAKIASDTKTGSSVSFSKRNCFACGKPIVTNQARAIKAMVPIGTTGRLRNETRHYCQNCYVAATKAS
jgi:uncharacterized protein with PIN domain